MDPSFAFLLPRKDPILPWNFIGQPGGVGNKKTKYLWKPEAVVSFLFRKRLPVTASQVLFSISSTASQAYKTTTKKTKGQLAEGNDLPKDKISFQPAVLAFGCSFFSL